MPIGWTTGGGWRSWVAVVAAVALVVGAVAACSESEPDAAGRVDVSPAESARLTLPGSGGVVVPVGAVEGEGTLSAEERQIRGRIPAAFTAVGDAYDLVLADTALTGNVEITLAAPDPEEAPTAGSAEAAVMAFLDQDARRWRPVEGSFDPEARTVTATVDHLSLWSAFRFNTSRAFDQATDLLRGFIGVANADQPTCPNESDAASAGIAARSDSGDLVKWCVGAADTGEAVLRVTNNRNYAIEVTHPDRWSAQRVGAPDPVFERALNVVVDAASPVRQGLEVVILPGGGTVDLLVPPGASGFARVAPSVTAYLLSGIVFGAKTMAMTFGSIPGAPRTDPSRTADAVDLAFQSGECASSLELLFTNEVATAQAAGELFRTTVDLAVTCLKQQWRVAYGLAGWIAAFFAGVATWLVSGVVLVFDGIGVALDSAIYWDDYTMTVISPDAAPRPAASLEEVMTGLLTAWTAGDRDSAVVFATEEVVDALFELTPYDPIVAIPYPNYQVIGDCGAAASNPVYYCRFDVGGQYEIELTGQDPIIGGEFGAPGWQVVDLYVGPF